MTFPKSSADPVGAAMRELLLAAKILQQNSEGCATNHYGHDCELNGLPDWLADTKKAIMKAEAALSTPPVQAITEAQAAIGPEPPEKPAVVRPAPSDDAQRDDEILRLPCPLKVGHTNFGKGVAMSIVQTSINRLAERAPSTLAEFREACARLAENTFEYAKVYEDDGGANIAAAIRALPIPETWRLIETAPKYQWIFVYCPEREGLSELVSLCLWHPDAGFCVDEIREPTLWQPVSLPVPPAKEQK